MKFNTRSANSTKGKTHKNLVLCEASSIAVHFLILWKSGADAGIILPPAIISMWIALGISMHLLGFTISWSVILKANIF